MKKILFSMIFLIVAIFAINVVYAVTSSGVSLVLEHTNHTMVSGYHNLTVTVSTQNSCGSGVFYNQTFNNSLINGRSNITLNNLAVNYNEHYYICYYIDGTIVSGIRNTTLGQGLIQARDINTTSLSNLITINAANITGGTIQDGRLSSNVSLINSTGFIQALILWTNVSGRPTTLSFFTDDLGTRGYTSLSNFTNDRDLINSSFSNNTYIFKVNESFLNVNSSNSSLWWAGVSGFSYRWFVIVNNKLYMNETTLNGTIDTMLVGVQTNVSNLQTTVVGVQNNLTEINGTLNTRLTTLEGRPFSNASASGVATKLALFNNATHLIASDISEDSTQINFTKNIYVRNNLTVNGTFTASIDATNITSGTLSILRLPNLNNSHFHDAKNLTGVLQVANGGTGLSTFPALRLLWTSATDVINVTSLGSSLAVSGGLIEVVNATSTQKIDVFRNNSFIGTSDNLNFIAGSNITINVTYDSGLGQNNVTIASFGGGGGADGVGGNATAGGNANYIAKFTNSTNLGNSLFYEDGKNMNLTGGNLSLSENIRFRTNGNGILDSNGKWMMKFNQYDVSVNYFNLYNSPGSDAIQIGVQGDGGNVDLQLAPLGTGSVDVGSRLKMQNSDSTNSTNFITSATQTAQINYTLPAAQGSANTVLLNNGSGILSWLMFSNNFNIISGRVFSVNATETQKIDVFHNNSYKGTSENLNFINGGNITLSVIYDSGLDQNNVTITSTGGGGGTADGVGGNATAGGTANYIAKFTNQTNLGNSVAYDNGSNIGVGLITPNEKLTLNGSLSFTDSDYAPAATSGFGKLYSTIGGVDSLTMLNLHFDGSDGSTTFSDGSSYNKLMVANGNVQIDTAQSKFGGASGLFDGTGDYLKSTDVPTDFDFGSGNFTIDTWVYLNENMGVAQRLIGSRGGGTDGWDSSGGHHWTFLVHTDSKLYFQYYTGSGTGSVISDSAISINSAWHHIAVVKNGSMTTLYVDGGSVGNASVGTISEPTGGTQALAIGSTTAGSGAWNGWIDEFRISKGVIRWGSNFTVPSSAYSVPGLNYIDNAGTITSISGTVPVTRGGTGLTTIPASRLLWSSALNTFTTLSLGNSLINASGTILSVVNNTNIQKINVLNNGTTVGTRSSVNFIPGSQVSLTISDNSGSDRVDVTINSTATSSGDVTAVNKSNYVYGVASNLKVTNANPDEHTKYLLHFDGLNASTVFTDSSLYMQSVTPTGTVAVTNDTQKFGSVGHFNGASNSYLALTSVGDWEWGNFGTKNFTFDFWLNFKQLPVDSTGQYIWIYYQVAVEERSITVKNVSGMYTLNYKNNDDTWTGNLTGLTSGTWHHYAIVRNSTSLNIFFDGGLVSSRAITTNSPLRTAVPQIGTFNSGSYLFNGYMDDFRFSLGNARWNSNFTIPASEYYGYPQYKLNISADAINLYDGENATTVKNVMVSPDINVTGVNGLDAGYEANSVWYYAWVINNGATTAGLLSTSSTSPKMPAGYSFKKLVSAVYNNAGGNFSGFQHVGGDYVYLYPVKIINDGGSTTTTAIDLSTTVPRRELTKGVFGKMLTNGAFTLNMNPVQFKNNVASDNSVTEFSVYNGYNGPPGPSQWIIRNLIEEQTIYYQLDANTLDLWVNGFTTRS